MDIPTVKNAKLALQTLSLLQYPRERIALIVNRPLARADIRESDISRTLDMAITCTIPGDKDIGVAVNRGIPVTVASPRSPASKIIRELAELLLPSGSLGDSKPAPGEAPVNKHVANKPSAGRHSLLKAGVSRFSKQKDKKAA
jgi:pilus assembly protein CpaE